MLLLDTPTEVYKFLLYCYLQGISQCIRFCLFIITRICLSHKCWNNSFCDIPKRHFSLQTLILLPFQNLRLPRFNRENKTPTRSKHWKTGLYWGLENLVSYYYNRKVLVYNIYLVDNPYSYGELSIFVPFLIARDTCWGNIFLFLSFVRLKFHISTYLTMFEYVLSFSF